MPYDKRLFADFFYTNFTRLFVLERHKWSLWQTRNCLRGFLAAPSRKRSGMRVNVDNYIMRDEAMARIAHVLESDGTFVEIMEEILSCAERYLCTSHAAVLQVGSDNTLVNTVISYVAEEEAPLKTSNISKQKFAIGADVVKYCTLSSASAEERAAMDIFGVLTSVVAPVFVNNECRVYFAVFDVHHELSFDEVKRRFISDVAKIIETVAQKKLANNSMLSSYEVLREILNSIGSGIMVFGRSDGEIYFENEAAEKTDEVRRTIQGCVREYMMKENTVRQDKTVAHYDPESGIWFEIKLSDLTWIDGSSVIVCTAVDITQKKKNRQKIEYQANNDFLTGLYNRMKCEQDLREVVKEALLCGQKGALLFIDLDDFKHINDGLGHQYGDLLLQQIAAALQGVPGLRGRCYRMGGDEFVVIIKPEQYSSLQKIIKNVLALFNRPWYLMGTEYFCTMSMGVATFPDNSDEAHDIVKMADMAMYDAKKSGKNRCNFYDGSKKRNSVKRLDIENNMRQAVASKIQEFIVFYQPVVDAVTRKCVSCEALVRWDSKALGFMGPGDFIPLAEYLGLITDIGDYVLEEACRQCREWNDAGYKDFRVNVNLSVVQLLQKNVVENIGHILSRTGVNPRNIVLEITESFAINDMDRVMKIISGLKALGPKIALDDFGTGYSSLNYIKQLPLNIIKVDKTFIDDIVEDDYAQAFVRLIVDLSKTIGTQIVVEGVENKEQYELLRDIGVNYIQGYFFGKPVSADKFENEYLGRDLNMK